uniref:Uncharacterized protein n=1 Tax=Populus alba TaxID=43335 RepID=A0A4U5QBH9_POPAL|nr:hypothetical protein D5086_0000130030 [Populus alba]
MDSVSSREDEERNGQRRNRLDFLEGEGCGYSLGKWGKGSRFPWLRGVLLVMRSSENRLDAKTLAGERGEMAGWRPKGKPLVLVRRVAARGAGVRPGEGGERKMRGWFAGERRFSLLLRRVEKMREKISAGESCCFSRWLERKSKPKGGCLGEKSKKNSGGDWFE